MDRLSKLFCLLLAVLVLLCLKLPSPAIADTLSLTSGGSELTPISMTAVGDALYIYTSNGTLFSYEMLTGEVTPVQANLPGQLFLVENSGGLAISMDDGWLYQLNVLQSRAEPKKIVQLNLEGLLQPEDMPREGLYGGWISPFQRAVVQGNTLYLMMSTMSISQCVVAFDLSTGDRRFSVLKEILDIAAYTKDSLLAISYSNDGKSRIDIYNVQSGKKQDWMILPSKICDRGLVYDEESGTVYALGSGVIYSSREGGPFQEAGYSSLEQYAEVTNVSIGGGKYFALVPGEAVYSFMMDSANAVKSLRLVNSWWDEDVIRAFRNEYPATPLIFESVSNVDEEQLHKKMLSHDSYFDVYVADVGTSLYHDMLDKGYVQNLSVSGVLTAASQKMYPYFAEQLSKDGELMAFPLRVSGYVLSFHVELFKENNIEPPQSMMEFLDFCAGQAEAGDHAVMYISESLSKEILNYLISAYEADLLKRTGSVDYDTPLFKKMMDKWYECAPSIEKASTNTWIWDEDNEPLLGMTSAVLRFKYDQLPLSHQPLKMSLEDGGAPVIPAYMEVAVINPASLNIPAAMQFLEFYAQHMGRELSIILFPDDNEPVIDPVVEKRIPGLKRDIAKAEKALAEAKDEEKKNLESQLDFMKTNLDSVMENNLWSYSAKTIKAYRDVADYLAFCPRNIRYSSSQKQISELIDRFAQSRISCTEFVQEMIRIQRTMKMEE